MRKIVIHLEPADGEAERPTSVRIEHGDGSLTVRSDAEMDEPAAGGATWRDRCTQLRDAFDDDDLPKLVRKPEPPAAPTLEDVKAGNVEEING